MKQILFKSILIISLISLYGCPSDDTVDMHTKINADGTCSRELIMATDSAFMAGDTSANPFPMKLDSSWKIEFRKSLAADSSSGNEKSQASEEKNEWLAVGSKTYPSVQELESFRYDHSGWDSVVPEINYNKNFRWFYTYYHFSESYPACNIFKRIPISDYLTDLEQQTLLGENTELFKGLNGIEINDLLDGLNAKSEEWFNRNMFEESYLLFAKNYRDFNNPPVDSETFVSLKDSVYKFYTSDKSFDFDDIEDVLNKYFKSNVYNPNDDLTEELNQVFINYSKTSGMRVQYKLSMPGKIIETNAPFMKNDTLSWKINDERFFFKTYILSATSRKTNIWAFIFTGIIIIFSLLALFVRRRTV